MRRIRVLVVADSAELLERVGRAAARDAAIDLVGNVCSAAAAVDLSGRWRVDVVVVDRGLPDLDGLEVTRRIKRHAAPPAVLVVALSADSQETAETAAAGADALLARSEIESRLLPLLHSLFRAP